MPRFALALMLLPLLSACSAGTHTALPTSLRTEYLVEPLGIDAPSPRFSWITETDRRGWRQSAYRVIVSGSRENLEKGLGDFWDTGRVESDASAQIGYAGIPLASRNAYHWRVQVWDEAGEASAWSLPASFSMGLLSETEWKAEWIGSPTDTAATATPEAVPSPLLRTSFSVDGPVERAVVYATALGLYELRLNGQRVGDRYLSPEWTDYKTRIQYQTYDVTDLITSGDNAIGAFLGDGWFAGRLGGIRWEGPFPERGVYGPNRRLLLRLDLELADGSTRTVVSDGSWNVDPEGPIRQADNFLGETYDARLEQPGWDQPGFDDAAWLPVVVDAPTEARLVAQMNEPIRIVEEVPAVAKTEPEPGVHIYDLGQNIAGWVRIRLDGPEGTSVQLRHGEMLDLDGSLYVENLARAIQTDTYTLDGKGERWFEPHFTYHGFRYVEVRGVEDPLPLDAVVGRVLASDAPLVGAFETSNPLLNQLYSNILWSQRGNMHSVPTDCPQRDERMGWMGDVLVFAQTSLFNMDMSAFYTKFVRDVRDAQMPDGRYPDFAPNPYYPGPRFYDAAGWADAGVFVPWRMYENYGDTRLLAEHFESMARFIDNIHERNPDHLWTVAEGNQYSDWLNGDTIIGAGYPKTGGTIPYTMFATAFFARSTQLVANMAAVLGRQEDVTRYGDLAAAIRAAFVKAFVSADGRMEGDTQSGYAIALQFDLLPDSLEDAAARHMLAAFEPYGGRLSTGFHSTIPMMKQLVRWGETDRAYRLLESTELPSWGYSIAQGATTIWERWDGFVAGRGFQSAGMNSFNHYAFGSIGEWMIRHVLGINPDEETPAYRRFTIAPKPGGSLTWAKGSYRSIQGLIASDWRFEKGRIRLEVTIPANTTAIVRVPTTDPDGVTEGGSPVSEAEGVMALPADEGVAVYEVGSGTYVFEAALR